MRDTCHPDGVSQLISSVQTGRRRRVPGLYLFRAVLLLFPAGVSGCFVIPREDRRLPPPSIEAPEPSYDTVAVKRQDMVRSKTLSGRLVPLTRKDLFFRYQGGRVTHLYVRPGQRVLRGELLAELNTGELDFAVIEADILLEKAKNRHEMRVALSANRYDIRDAELDVHLAQVRLDRLDERLRGSRLISPLEGEVTYVAVVEGEAVETFVPLVTVVDPSELILECQTQDTSLFHYGLTVEVRLKQEIYSGKVISDPRPEEPFGPESENRGSTDFTVIIQIQDIPADASVGDIAVAGAKWEDRKNVLVIPLSAVRDFDSRTYVHVLEDGLKKERDVEIGFRTSTEVEVVRGLKEGDLVIRR